MSRGTTIGRARRDPYLSAVLRDPCAYCGGPAELLDHIDAGSRGGPERWENLTAACRGCNGAKGTKSLLAALAWRLWVRCIAQRTQTFVASWNGVGRG